VLSSCIRAFIWSHGWAAARAAGDPNVDSEAGVRSGMGADQRKSTSEVLRDWSME